VYCALAKELPAPSLRYIEQAWALCIDSLPLLAPVLTLLLRALLSAYQADHHSALEQLRQALRLLKRSGESAGIDLEWLWGVKAVLFHNLAAESMNVFLRADAVKYVIRAAAVAEQHTAISSSLRARILAYKGKLMPSSPEGELIVQSPKAMATGKERQKEGRHMLRSRSVQLSSRPRHALSGRLDTVTYS